MSDGCPALVDSCTASPQPVMLRSSEVARCSRLSPPRLLAPTQAVKELAGARAFTGICRNVVTSERESSNVLYFTELRK